MPNPRGSSSSCWPRPARASLPAGVVSVSATGAEAAAGRSRRQVAGDLYRLCARREFRLAGRRGRRRAAHVYAPGDLRSSTNGASPATGRSAAQSATLDKSDGAIAFRFHARDLHLVLGPGADGKPVRFRVTIDGAAPGESHGADIDAAGEGVVTDQRLYQLVRQSGPIMDHTFAIQFLDPGVQAYAFTFG